MNKFINFLERKIGKYAIKRLPLYMVIMYAIGYMMQIINPAITDVISLNPYAIAHGQVWRLVSWLLIPPAENNLFFVAIMLFFYYSIGTNLERTWGEFYFNYYIFSGILFTIAGAFLLMGYSYWITPDLMMNLNQEALRTYGEACPALYGGDYFFRYYSSFFSTYYINMSIFLAYAATYPEMQVLIFFIIPVKVKVLGIIYAIMLVFNIIMMRAMGVFIIGASLLNFVVFFLATRKGMHRTLKDIKRQREFKKKIQPVQRAKISKHKCAICGRTDDQYPDLEFRFCSKCDGNYEYCQEHLFTHKHVKR